MGVPDSSHKPVGCVGVGVVGGVWVCVGCVCRVCGCVWGWGVCVIFKQTSHLRMDVMSPCILCYAGLKCVCCCQIVGNYMHNYRKHNRSAVVHEKTRYDVTSNLNVE